ncbi:uncharacterized protein LOC117337350 [Pecten maximus]|uniref:uncharacterized protein LOC117337350 n=1 Tax=Pecten maximus TaxID=6579 RepID=UPI001458D607|nr:uncharacterized protein LOC117337350 [Pecten maximus]XP_033754197.1 uncharacterized protein LOC117337350 [Pecten maximus]
MPRRLLSDHLFGETANSSILRMSNEAMLQTKMKNEHERWKLLKELKQLISNEKVARIHNSRELEMLRDEYTKMIACGRVYKEHGFERYDPALNRRPTTEKNNIQNNNLTPFSRQTSLCSTQLPDIDDAPGYVRIVKRNPIRRSKSDVSEIRRTDTVYTRTRFSSIAESNISDISTPVDNRNIDIDDLENDMEAIPEEKITNAEEEEEKKITSALSTILAIKLHALVMWKQQMHKIPERAVSERPRFVRKVTTGEAPPSTNIRAPLSRPSSLLPGDCKTVFGMKKFIEREVSNRIVVLSSPKKDKAKLDKMIEKARLPQLIERRKTTSAIFRDFRTYKESQHSRKPEGNIPDQNRLERHKTQPNVLDYTRLEAIKSGADIVEGQEMGANTTGNNRSESVLTSDSLPNGKT